MSIFSEIFSWWGGNTWSNRIYTARFGKFVGEDEFGNRYYVQSTGLGPLGVPRRWVIYRNDAEASQIGPAWHGWMHYTVDTPPLDHAPYVPRPWQRPHEPNHTGSAKAHRPAGSALSSQARPAPSSGYQSWKPD